MSAQAFALTAPDNGSDEAEFLAAWKNAIALTGHPSWFGVHDDLQLHRSRDKNELQPRVKEIAKAINAIPISTACLVAAMVGFFNPAEGARLATKIDANGLGDIARALNHAQRVELANLLINYRGW